MNHTDLKLVAEYVLSDDKERLDFLDQCDAADVMAHDVFDHSQHAYALAMRGLGRRFYCESKKCKECTNKA